MNANDFPAYILLIFRHAIRTIYVIISLNNVGRPYSSHFEKQTMHNVLPPLAITEAYAYNNSKRKHLYTVINSNNILSFSD